MDVGHCCSIDDLFEGSGGTVGSFLAEDRHHALRQVGRVMYLPPCVTFSWWSCVALTSATTLISLGGAAILSRVVRRMLSLETTMLSRETTSCCTMDLELLLQLVQVLIVLLTKKINAGEKRKDKKREEGRDKTRGKKKRLSGDKLPSSRAGSVAVGVAVLLVVLQGSATCTAWHPDPYG